jgi:HPt (histidine-containing phosphotransfer) domain-containing protein
LRRALKLTAYIGMSSVPPPNDELAELASVLGEDNVRTLVRTFLRDFPASFAELSGPGERKNRHRISHSMKSNSRLMGAHALSQRMAHLEHRLEEPNGGDITPDDLRLIMSDFEAVAGPLRAFVGAAP